MHNAPTPTTVMFYFDPLCPWAWCTSLWLREVRRNRPVQIDWKFFSLAGIQDHDDPWHGPLRIAALARREGGNEAVDSVYLALGRLFHEREDSFDRIHMLADIAQPFLAEVGIDPALASRALSDPSTIDEVVHDHREAADRYGAFGVPWLVIGDDDPGFFGPVIGEVLQGDEALALWDHFQWIGTRPYLYELKRGLRKSLPHLAGLSDRFSSAAPRTTGAS